MIKHTLDISQRPAHLKLRNKQLILCFEDNKERHFSCEDVGLVRTTVPPDGEVRVMQFTDKQFSRMEVFSGKRRVRAEETPAQLEMF